MAELTKSTTKEYYVCRKCEKNLESLKLKGEGGDLFGLGFGGSILTMYCNNKECGRFGDLTIVGIKKTE